jgi:glutathione S-transferase
MPNMRLYHSAGTRSTRVLWTLEEIGVPYAITVLTVEERRGEQHRQRHPLGRVPVLELANGQTLFESAGICLYLTDRHPSAGLAPLPDAPDRPLLYQWLFFAMTELEPTLIRWMHARREGTDETEPTEDYHARRPVLQQAIADREWLLGEQFSIADIICAKVLSIARNFQLDMQDDAVSAYIRRALDRPAHKRADAIGRESAPAER